MESLEMSQIVLYYTTSIILILITVFLIRLIVTATKLAKKLSKTTDILNAELEPTLKELKETLGSVNSMVKTTEEQVSKVKTALDAVMLVPFKVGQKMRGLFSGLYQGLQAGINLFKK